MSEHAAYPVERAPARDAMAAPEIHLDFHDTFICEPRSGHAGCICGSMFQRSAPPRRPGRVTRLLGVILQNDGASRVGGWFIHPVETLDRRLAGADRPARAGYPGLAMHAGLHVVMEDGREMVAEQLMGTIRNNFSDGLNWTPIEDFRERDRGGWDTTVPATAFRGIDNATVARIVDRLNT